MIWSSSLTKKEKYGIILTMKSIIDGYNAGYEDAERTILAKLEAMISDAELVSLAMTLEAEAFYTLKNVRRTLANIIDEK